LPSNVAVLLLTLSTAARVPTGKLIMAKCERLLAHVAVQPIHLFANDLHVAVKDGRPDASIGICVLLQISRGMVT